MQTSSTIDVPEAGLEIDGNDAAGPPPTHERIDHLLVPASRIEARVAEMARDIVAAHDASSTIVLVVLLRGAFVFAADLARALHRAGAPSVRVEFVRASAYGDDLKQAGEAERRVSLGVLPTDLEGTAVVVVDDLVDQGYSLERMKDALAATDAASVRLCVLLEKMLDRPSAAVAARRAALAIDFVGFRVPDRWVAGYGIDAAGEFRELSDIVAVREEAYR